MKSVSVYAAIVGGLVTVAATGAPGFDWQHQKMKNLSSGPIVRQMRVEDGLRASVVKEAVASMRGDREFFEDVPEAKLWNLAANEGYEFADLDGDGFRS